jgi:exodeoxyribonuclease V alpha subunit
MQVLETTPVKFELGNDQTEAVLNIFKHRVCILAGSAGTGKTTIVRIIIRLARMCGLRSIYLMAPTGAAARRATRATGHKGTTIHRGIGIGGPNAPPIHSTSDPIDAELLILDELSMVDVGLMAMALNAIQAGTHVILVGDPKQLPSVGPGAVLRDLMDSGVVPVFELKEVRRNKGAILRMAYSTWSKEAFRVINDDYTPVYDDLAFFPVPSGKTTPMYAVNDNLSELVVKRFRANGGDPKRVKVLSPVKGKETDHPVTGIKGHWTGGTIPLNKALALAHLGPLKPGEVTYKHKSGEYRVGHRILWLKNTVPDDPVKMVNSQDADIAAIEYVDDEPWITIATDDDDGNPVTYKFRAADYDGMFELGYCRTFNKAQGEEYPVVIIVIRPREWLSTERIYTGITRTEERCEILGVPELSWQTVPENRQRRTGLKAKLIKVLKKEEAA